MVRNPFHYGLRTVIESARADGGVWVEPVIPESHS
jgi:hypothetical protein